MSRTLVNLESPYAGDIERNTLYARFCMRDSIVNHNESPFASHLLYTQPHVLNEHVPEERALGIATGLEFTRMTEKTVVYIDLGVTNGMEQAIKSAENNGVEVERRKLNNDDWELYFHETLSLRSGSQKKAEEVLLGAVFKYYFGHPKPPKIPGQVLWDDELPEPPTSRIVDDRTLKYLAWVLPILLLTVIAYGIAESVGWVG